MRLGGLVDAWQGPSGAYITSSGQAKAFGVCHELVQNMEFHSTKLLLQVLRENHGALERITSLLKCPLSRQFDNEKIPICPTHVILEDIT